MENKPTEKAFEDAVGKPRFKKGDMAFTIEEFCSQSGTNGHVYCFKIEKQKIIDDAGDGCFEIQYCVKDSEDLMTKEEAKAKFNSWIENE